MRPTDHKSTAATCKDCLSCTRLGAHQPQVKHRASLLQVWRETRAKSPARCTAGTRVLMPGRRWVCGPWDPWPQHQPPPRGRHNRFSALQCPLHVLGPSAVDTAALDFTTVPDIMGTLGPLSHARGPLKAATSPEYLRSQRCVSSVKPLSGQPLGFRQYTHTLQPTQRAKNGSLRWSHV